MSKADVSVTKQIWAQYWSNLCDDWGIDPWSNIGNSPAISTKDALNAIKAYKKKYSGGTNRFRIVTRTVKTSIRVIERNQI